MMHVCLERNCPALIERGRSRCDKHAHQPWAGRGRKLLHGRGLWLLRKWRDVVDKFGVVFVYTPDVAAPGTAVVVNARLFAHGPQKPGQLTLARRTLRDLRHGWGGPSCTGYG